MLVFNIPQIHDFLKLSLFRSDPDMTGADFTPYLR